MMSAALTQIALNEILLVAIPALSSLQSHLTLALRAHFESPRV